jgi:hypothetical protein
MVRGSVYRFLGGEWCQLSTGKRRQQTHPGGFLRSLQVMPAGFPRPGSVLERFICQSASFGAFVPCI